MRSDGKIGAEFSSLALIRMKYGKGMCFETWQWGKIKSNAGGLISTTLQEYTRSRTQLAWEFPEMMQKKYALFHGVSSATDTTSIKCIAFLCGRPPEDLCDQCEESTSNFGLNTTNLEQLMLNPAMELCQSIVWIADHDTSLPCM